MSLTATADSARDRRRLWTDRDSRTSGESTTLDGGDVSERPKVQLSKSCVRLKRTVGSNPTVTAILTTISFAFQRG